MGAKLLVDELHRPDIEAAGRLGSDQQGRLATQLARQHGLLLVAAGELAHQHADAAGADVVVGNKALGPLGAGAAVEDPAPRQWRLGDALS